MKSESKREKSLVERTKKRTEKKPDDDQPDITNMADLESEESAEQRRNQTGRRLIILTPDQMPTRLPIYLAQLKAGNNSEKHTNEKRQLLYSLYHSKKLAKTIYNSLVNTI